jgi:hypothetical protein
MKSLGYITLCEQLNGNRVRLFFSDGIVVERVLPGHAGKVLVIDEGLGLQLSNGTEIGVYELRHRKIRGCKNYRFSVEDRWS